MSSSGHKLGLEGRGVAGEAIEADLDSEEEVKTGEGLEVV